MIKCFLNPKKLIYATRVLFEYLYGKSILYRHYDVKYVSGSRFFQKGRFGFIGAPIWKMAINDYLSCKRLRVNSGVPWPVSSRISVVHPENITFHPDDLNNFQGFGNYFQAIGHITIGKGTYIAPNVGIITSNHSITDLDKHDTSEPVNLGNNCWIGMNSMILPGVVLGEKTIVGAGSVVTKSFSEGNCVIAGNPAKLIRKLDFDEGLKVNET